MKKEKVARPYNPVSGAEENYGQCGNKQFENLIKIGIFKELHRRRLLSDFQLDASMKMLNFNVE